MRTLLAATLSAALCLTAATPAHAQGLFKRMADRVLGEVVGGSDEEEEEAAAPVPRRTAAAPARAASPAPRPAPTIRYPRDLPKPADWNAVRDAYSDFGKVRCTSCEGGYSYDGWARWPKDDTPRPYNGSRHILGELPVGHVHRWKGELATGTLTIVSEETISGFRCRRLLYRLEKGKAFAERPGLLCWGYANQFASSEGWNEVY